MTNIIIINSWPLLQLAAAKEAFSMIAAMIAAHIEDAPTIRLDELDELDEEGGEDHEEDFSELPDCY